MGILPPRVVSPNHLCDSIMGSSESPLPTRRSQGASILELNSFTFQWPCHLFQTWILSSTLFKATPQGRNRGMKNFSFLSFCPMAVTHPSTNQSQCCLTSVILRELVCQHGYGVEPVIATQHFVNVVKYFILKNINGYLEICFADALLGMLISHTPGPLVCGWSRSFRTEKT